MHNISFNCLQFVKFHFSQDEDMYSELRVNNPI
jgi:hypothetical protein